MPDVAKIFPSDRHALAQVDTLLAAEGIRRDPNLDYICGIYEDDQLIATGSAFGNTLRCFAVDHGHQGEGLLNTIITHLMDIQQERGNYDIFLYTKIKTARFFHDLGFYEIARVDDALIFMENQRDGFTHCLDRFQREAAAISAPADPAKPVGAIVMNANPFTRGHQYLISQAASQTSLLHLFLLSEDASLFPFAIRQEFVRAGIAALPNVVLHASGPYIISQATFPSYFQKDDDAVSRSHACLDIAIFQRIARALGITCRYVGEEPFSHVTSLYNQIMQDELPRTGIDCHVLPRLESAGQAISASTVRQLLKDGMEKSAIDWPQLAQLLPPAELDWLQSPTAGPVLRRLAAADEVRHH
ncbi:MAG: [citrate (pro-3S)-lyase] ligase [Selenomonas sp.]|jgi:[citrate (pro-3S)-lyase] ligase|nr:[citrate (pro-3S)-lyase] ligase [Selenomonas sp.]